MGVILWYNAYMSNPLEGERPEDSEQSDSADNVTGDLRRMSSEAVAEVEKLLGSRTPLEWLQKDLGIEDADIFTSEFDSDRWKKLEEEHGYFAIIKNPEAVGVSEQEANRLIFHLAKKFQPQDKMDTISHA